MAHAPVVLLVEDDDSNREMYALCLELAGYWVLNARNGTEGLINARTFSPHVVVTDVSMPGMDGWELARALREDARTASIHIIAVSGLAQDQELERHMRQRHVDRVLTKPCLPDDLIKEIHTILSAGHGPEAPRRHERKQAAMRERSNDRPRSAATRQRRRA